MKTWHKWSLISAAVFMLFLFGVLFISVLAKIRIIPYSHEKNQYLLLPLSGTIQEDTPGSEIIKN